MLTSLCALSYIFLPNSPDGKDLMMKHTQIGARKKILRIFVLLDRLTLGQEASLLGMVYVDLY